ncbi:hypothetical protein [Streptomyces ureilyticus]|uniref:Major capsid protein n=1 Tax=Streptomyces ureilyticus TaxID=1775131 RepID=A0ABX0EA20_9ACTN|nr:hypothetical protein [Streptomyces ureilyticus]NGO48991.1 hypothetical protein [Streptomyces ureilyticus]
MTNNVVTTPSEQDMVARARAQAVEVLAPSRMFQALSLPDQQSIYLSLVEENLDEQRNRYGVARAMATDTGEEMGYKGYDPGFTGDTAAFNELVESVDFPAFVADLLGAVFDANLKVMKQQTDAYIKLMKEATKSTADFIKKIGDDESFATLAESKSDQFNVVVEKQPDGSSKLALTNPEGDKVDTEDAEVKRAILEAKINMAKEHRAALREVLLMGVTRLVVKKGLIEAGVEFSIKANRESKAHHDDTNINVATLETSFGGGFGAMFGGPSAELSVSNTNIQVNTSDKKATDDLSATLKGLVRIEFATDYFKLDNFANMYADGGVKALTPPPAGAPGQAPPK